MTEVKADVLEQSFEAIEQDDDGVAALKEELDQLKAKIANGVIAAQRPALDGVKSAAANVFIEQYLRRGIESGLETKAVGSSSDAIGGYAVPKEIDEQIDSTLVAISPIRAIANVVKVGSAGYRKLVTTGGTPSGWVGFEAARPETNTPSFTEIVPASGELYANPAASQQMLDDAMFDVEAWLAGDVELADNEHWLESRDEDALIQGANLAAVGSELIQFGVATAIGPGLFRLSKLLRGRRGTEWAMNAHSPGEHFVMIGSGSVRPIELPPEALGAQVDVTAFAVGDGNGTTIGTVARGEALRPPSPVHVRWSVALAGSLELSWVRRSRNGWMWRDEIETPLGETGERYRVRVQAETGAIELETTASQATVSAAELAAVGSGAATVTVFQVGDYALSRPAAVSIILP